MEVYKVFFITPEGIVKGKDFFQTLALARKAVDYWEEGLEGRSGNIEEVTFTSEQYYEYFQLHKYNRD